MLAPVTLAAIEIVPALVRSSGLLPVVPIVYAGSLPPEKVMFLMLRVVLLIAMLS
jgi:hypothetical protein